MDARDVIAEAISEVEYADHHSVKAADRALAALVADGYVIVRREQVGWIVCSGPNEGRLWGMGQAYGHAGKCPDCRPVYVDVIEEES